MNEADSLVGLRVFFFALVFPQGHDHQGVEGLRVSMLGEYCEKLGYDRVELVFAVAENLRLVLRQPS